MKQGIVSLVGAGCGDPDFLTLKGLDRLKGCEVLVYDSLVSERTVERASSDCEKIYVGKRYGRHAMKQEEINDLLIKKAQEGKRVVRLKGGDPYVFGRGGEEFLALRSAGIVCEEIPGITSSIAVPAAAGIPVTHRGLSRSFTVITGTTAAADGREGLQMDFAALAELEGTLVILMGVHHLEEIAEGLMRAGKAPETPCAVVMEGTLSGQRCVRAPLSDIAERSRKEKIEPPAVIVIGAVAGLELLSPKSETDCFAGFPEYGRGPEETLCGQVEEGLSGVSVGVTGTAHFARKLSCALQKEGAAVCDMSFMEILENPQPLPKLDGYGWLVFTSPNGVRVFLDKMKREKRDLRGIAQNQIAVIGPGTAEPLEAAGIFADYMPQSYDAQHLAEGLAQRICEALLQERNASEEQNAAAKPALFLRASQGSEALPRIFAEKGISYTEFPLYEIGADEKKRERVIGESPDYLVFGAGSGVRAYFEGRTVGFAAAEKNADRSGCEEAVSDGGAMSGGGGSIKTPRYVCMGEACGRELARFTEEAFLVAKESSVEGIVECIRGDLQQAFKNMDNRIPCDILRDRKEWCEDNGMLK